MSRLIILTTPLDLAALKSLVPGECLFIERWLQALHDETHPHWALRPFSISNLQKLYPEKRVRRNVALWGALEDELVRAQPDAFGQYEIASHEHQTDPRTRQECEKCVRLLAPKNSDAPGAMTARRNYAAQLVAAIQSNDTQKIMTLTPLLAAEAVAGEISARYLAQAGKNYLLNPLGEQKNTFLERLQDFLDYDICKQNRDSRETAPCQIAMRRPISVTDPSGKPQAVRIWKPNVNHVGSDELGWLEIPDGYPQLVLENVRDLLQTREAAASLMRDLTPTWLAVLRFLLPHRRVKPDSTIRWEGKDHEEKSTECPGHRSVFSTKESTVALLATTWLATGDRGDELQSSLYWLSMAYDVWGESLAHAAAIVWMAIEALGENPASCAAKYVARLPFQIADEVDDSLGSLVGRKKERAKGIRSPQEWSKALPQRNSFPNDLAWLRSLKESFKERAPNALLAMAIEDALKLLDDSDYKTALQLRIEIDLRLLQACRHAIAHKGEVVSEEPVSHYLATLGCECLRALYANQIDGSPYEGCLEGGTFIAGEVFGDHFHPVRIPAQMRIPKNLSVPLLDFNGHGHMVSFTEDQVRSILSGNEVEITSNIQAVHSHACRFLRDGGTANGHDGEKKTIS